MVSVTQIPPNQWAEILEITAEEKLQSRLADMGFRPGAEVELVGQAPMNGPYLVRTRGATFALREGEAACIQVRDPRPSS